MCIRDSFIAIPSNLSGQEQKPVHTAIALEQVIAFNLKELFPGMTIEGHYFFRVTRDADLELRDLEADDLMLALEQGLRKRRMGGEVARGAQRDASGRGGDADDRTQC